MCTRAFRRTQNSPDYFMHLERRILVTGGAGFLGSHLCEQLLARGSDVVCVDNFFTGAKRNIAHLFGELRTHPP
jgi:UDP-glucuronate decarboxylase